MPSPEQQLENLADLKPNWNSYGAAAPNSAAIARAREVLQLCSDFGIAATVQPSAQNGVCVEFDCGNPDIYADIEVFNDGTILACRYDYSKPNTKPRVWPIQGLDEIRKTIASVKADVVPLL